MTGQPSPDPSTTAGPGSGQDPQPPAADEPKPGRIPAGPRGEPEPAGADWLGAAWRRSWRRA